MRRSTRSAVLAAGVALGMLAVGLLGGCAQVAPTAPTGAAASNAPTAAADPSGTATGSAEPSATATSAPASPTASATPTASASTVAPEPEGAVFETQNGTMRLRVPAGWTVRDGSRLSADHSGVPWWENLVAFRSPEGTELSYSDGFGGNVGFLRTDFGVVAVRPTTIGDDVAAVSWWVQDSGNYFVHAAVATRASGGTEPVPEIVLPGVERIHMLTMVLLDDDQPAVATRAEAERLLASAPVLEALDVMATLELTGVDPSSMPPGVEP